MIKSNTKIIATIKLDVVKNPTKFANLLSDNGNNERISITSDAKNHTIEYLTGIFSFFNNVKIIIKEIKENINNNNLKLKLILFYLPFDN